MEERILAGRYRFEQPLGGTMGEVHLATDIELERQVVVKLLGTDADPQRFEREARAAASLAHPNIVQLFEYGDVDGRPYMVFEYLPGGSLEDRLAAGDPLPDLETERIAHDIAAGLAHAHAHGLVHRDLKPANVLFDEEGRAKIADFGIARLGGAGTLTEAGTVLGTAAYISPEQGAGEPATAASDVYSFGVVLFRMLTGRLPFEADDPMALVAMHRTLPPPPVTNFRRDVPPDLAALVGRALAKDPRRRPRDGAALVDALGGAGLPTAAAEAATAVLPATRRPRPGRDRRRLAAAVAAVALLAGGGIAVAVLATAGGSSPSSATTTRRSSTRTTTTRPATTAASSAPTTTARATAPTTTRSATTVPPPPRWR